MIVKVQFNSIELNMFKGKIIEESGGYSNWTIIILIGLLLNLFFFFIRTLQL